eukprot:ctg_2785.g520
MRQRATTSGRRLRKERWRERHLAPGAVSGVEPTIGTASVTGWSDRDAVLVEAELHGRAFAAVRQYGMDAPSAAPAAAVVVVDDAPLATAESVGDPKEVADDAAALLDDDDVLCMPRRPVWHAHMSVDELGAAERAEFLAWRRRLAAAEAALERQRARALRRGRLPPPTVLTPFEKNLEVWRQLWRVVERSDVLVQIVDARHPLLFYHEGLERYVKRVDTRKQACLLLNKADLLTAEQRRAWQRYFTDRGRTVLFFSAIAAATQETDGGEAVSGAAATAKDCSSASLTTCQQLLPQLVALSTATTAKSVQHTPPSPHHGSPHPTVLGFVGYPNVGKSSTINVLLGRKRVAVGATPGKTKHFQTHWVDERVVLCDCPGLVFPQVAGSAAELVCAGVLPVDQLRDPLPSVALVCARIPRAILEAKYGIRLPIPGADEDAQRSPTAAELLDTLARARGFMKDGGRPDQHRAARRLLKDYVAGRLLHVHLPPTEAMHRGENGQEGGGGGEPAAAR